MNNRYILIAFCISFLTFMTSCLSDDMNDVVYYDDAAISSFSIGTLTRTVYGKTTAGVDTVMTSNSSYDSYTFTIDHANGKIYNIDSLPTNVNVKKCVPTVTAKNSGYVYLKNVDNDSVKYLSADSIDFSQPRVLRCYANDGSWYRDYEVEVRIHKEATDSVYWQEKKTQEALKGLTALRGLWFRNRVIAYGNISGAGKALYTDMSDGNTWNTQKLPVTTSVSMVSNGETLFLLSAEAEIFSSEDGEKWSYEGRYEGLSTLVAASRNELYAITSDSRLMKSATYGKTWEEENTSGNGAFLPRRDISAVTFSTKTNGDIDKVIMIGNREEATDSTSVVWTKVVDTSTNAYPQNWMFQRFESYSWHKSPRLESLSVVGYEDGLLMLGGKGLGACSESPFSKFLISKDNGLTWYADERYYLPEGFAIQTTSFALVADSENYLWIICGDSGKVYRGYLSQLTWQ